jgi:hypothetical protein
MYTRIITPGTFAATDTTSITISTQIVNLIVQICYNCVCVVLCSYTRCVHVCATVHTVLCFMGIKTQLIRLITIAI